MIELFIVTLIFSFIGSISGVGGGIILKPIFDVFFSYDIITLNLIISFSVVAMSVATFTGHLRCKSKYYFEVLIILGLGSMVGGYLGSILLTNYCSLFSREIVLLIQEGFLLLLLIFSMIYITFYRNALKYDVSSPYITFLVGLLLGITCSFVSIGGGPVYVAFLIFLFSMDMKEASVNSVVLVLFSCFSQIIKLSPQFDLSILNNRILVYLVVISSIVGSFLGVRINKKIKEKLLVQIYDLVVVFVICVDIFNIIKILLYLWR